jgi:lipid A disaccharide synthetase
VPFIAAANLIACREVVPEFCFHRPEGWQQVLATARRLWTDDAARASCRQGLDEVRARLGAPGATARVADVVRAFLAAPPTRR